MAAIDTQPRQPDSRRFRLAFHRASSSDLLGSSRSRCIRTSRRSSRQREFDEHAPGLMADQGEPPPPSARAIYMRLNRNVPGKRKSWRELVRDACATQRRRARGDSFTARTGNSFIDESHVLVRAPARRRVPRQDADSQSSTTRRRQLIAENGPAAAPRHLPACCPTSAQILLLAGQLGWRGACELFTAQAPGAGCVVPRV